MLWEKWAPNTKEGRISTRYETVATPSSPPALATFLTRGLPCLGAQLSLNSSKSVENKLKYLLEKGSNLAPPAVRIGPTDKHPVSPKYLLVGHSTGQFSRTKFPGLKPLVTGL